MTTIGEDAFEGCTSLASITIPENVTSIGDYAFSGCTSLGTVYWNATNCRTADRSNYYSIFRDCKALTAVHIGENVESIPDYAFGGCTSLWTVYWNATNCTKAGDSSDPIFSGCMALTTVYIGENVENIPSYAFSNCTSLIRVYYGGDETSWNRISISKNNDSLESVTLYYYSETAPDVAKWAESNKWWHRDPDTGEILIWKKES